MRNWQAQPRGGARIGKRGTVKVLIWREMTQITQCCLKITKVRTQLILHNPLFTQEFYDYTRLVKNPENSYTTNINQPLNYTAG